MSDPPRVRSPAEVLEGKDIRDAWRARVRLNDNISFLDGWQHACETLQRQGKEPPQETEVVVHAREQVELGLASMGMRWG